MTRPSLRVRVVGYPSISFALLAVDAYIFWQWYCDQMPFIIALLALFFAVSTVKAYGEKRKWQRWQREEGEDAGNSHASRIISFGTILRMMLALAAIYVAVVYRPQLPEGSVPALALQGVKWVALLDLSVALVRLVVAWFRRKKKCEAVTPPAEAGPVFVSWMLDVPAYSPARADAERALPEYCVRLLLR